MFLHVVLTFIVVCGAYEGSCKELGAMATVEMQLDVKPNPSSLQSHLYPGFGIGENFDRTTLVK